MIRNLLEWAVAICSVATALTAAAAIAGLLPMAVPALCALGAILALAAGEVAFQVEQFIHKRKRRK